MRTAEMFDPDVISIYDLLYRLGLTANNVGFFYTSYAVRLALREPDRLLMVTKWLYPDVARQYDTSWGAVERGIRFSITKIWNNDPLRLQEVLQVPVGKKPSPARFLSLLVMDCMKNAVA